MPDRTVLKARGDVGLEVRLGKIVGLGALDGEAYRGLQTSEREVARAPARERFGELDGGGRTSRSERLECWAAAAADRKSEEPRDLRAGSARESRGARTDVVWSGTTGAVARGGGAAWRGDVAA